MPLGAPEIQLLNERVSEIVIIEYSFINSHIR